MSAELDYGYPDPALHTAAQADGTGQWRDDRWVPQTRAGIDAHRAEIEAIAADPTPATVENTLHPLGRAGGLLHRTQRAFSCVYSADADEVRRSARSTLAPELASHQDLLRLHPGLHARLTELHDRIARDETPASPEQQWFLVQELQAAELAGAGLGPEQQESLRALNQELSREETAYEQLQNHEAAQSAVHVTEESALRGVPAAQKEAVAQAAREAGYDRGWLLTLSMPVQQELLSWLKDRNTRERLHRASISRGSLPGEDERTTRQIGARIAVLRARRAQLLGFENHLESVLPGRTAPDRSSIERMLSRIASGSAARLADEIGRIAAAVRRADPEVEELEPWDISFGQQLVASAQQDDRTGDDAEGKGSNEGVPLESALQRVFHAAGRVYGISVVEREDLPSFAPGARSFEVFEGTAGTPGTGIGLFLLDLYARPTKSGGAWMNSFSVASSLTGTRPVVINCLNVTPAAPRAETVLSDDELRTLFHEFGHALHGLLAQAEFEELSGTAVPRDNVEFPSQVNEIFQQLHSGELEQPGRAPAEEELWGKGLSTFEHVAAVVLDLAWHTLSPEQAEAAASDPEAFEQVALDAWGLDHPLVPPRYGSGFFKHIFAGSGYAAGYYSYLWAEALAADAAEWFREAAAAGRLTEAGRHFRRELLARGNTRDPYESYRCAVGRQPRTEPLMRSLGLQPV